MYVHSHVLFVFILWCRLGEVEEVIGVTAAPFHIRPGFETLSHAMLRFHSGITASFQGMVVDNVLSNSPYFQVFGSEVSRLSSISSHLVLFWALMKKTARNLCLPLNVYALRLVLSASSCAGCWEPLCMAH